MPDLRSYAVGLEREIVPPPLTTLERVSRRRARRQVGVALALSTAVLVAFLLTMVGGPATDRGALPVPAVSPTTGPLSSLTPDDIVRLGGEASEVLDADDGVDASLAAYQACPGSAGRPETGAECRVAYRVTGPGGAHQTYVLTGPNEALGPVAYLGRGEFIVYCTICGDDDAFYTVSAALPAPRRLPAEGRPSRPRPGLTLVPCRGDTCIFDRTRRELAHLDLATLPFWVDELMTKTWVAQEPGIEVLPEGQVYVPPDILLGGGNGPSPALVVTSGRTARELTQSRTTMPARPGLVGWVGGNGQGLSCPCIVEPDAATITPVDLPADAEVWARSNAKGWWGLAGDQQSAWVFTGGSPAKVTVPKRSPEGGLSLADGDPSTIAFYEHVHRQEGSSHFLHASLDRGRTWRSVVVPESALRAEGPDGSASLDPHWPTWSAAAAE